MKYTFYVFSGSGNTDKICREIRGKLEKSGAETEYWRFRKGEKYPDAVRTDAVVIGYPVHAFNTPTPVTEFVKEIPEGKGRKAYLVATSGEPLTLNDCAFVKTGKMLEEKGWKLSGTYRYVMPYNIIFRHSEGMAARMWLAARKNIERDVKKIIEGKDGDVTEINGIKKILGNVFRIEHAAMPIIGRSFYATDKCIGCGACEKVCPQANIYLKDGKPVFGKNCVGCMGCAFACPKDAVRTGVLNCWRVNGKYDFGHKPATDDEVCRYLGKTYLKYFQKAEDMVK